MCPIYIMCVCEKRKSGSEIRTSFSVKSTTTTRINEEWEVGRSRKVRYFGRVCAEVLLMLFLYIYGNGGRVEVPVSRCNLSRLSSQFLGFLIYYVTLYKLHLQYGEHHEARLRAHYRRVFSQQQTNAHTHSCLAI